MRTAAAACQDHVNVQFTREKCFKRKAIKNEQSSLGECLHYNQGMMALQVPRALDTGVKEKSEETQSKPESAKDKLSKLFRR